MIYTPANLSFTIYKRGVRGSKLYRHIFVMMREDTGWSENLMSVCATMIISSRHDTCFWKFILSCECTCIKPSCIFTEVDRGWNRMSKNKSKDMTHVFENSFYPVNAHNHEAQASQGTKRSRDEEQVRTEQTTDAQTKTNCNRGTRGNTVDSLSRSPRDFLKYFGISIPRHIRICRIEEKNKSNNHISRMNM